ncbi:MAG: hypothetical protein ACYC4P_15380 [Thermoanaerobaculia bacterium]
MATTADRAARWASGAVLAAALALALPAAGQEDPIRGGTLPGPLPLFPADNWWNQDVSGAPVDPNSAAFVQFIGATRGLHPDFGGDSSPAPEIYGMVYMTVPGDQALVPVVFDYDDESDVGAPGRPAGYPIPVEAKAQPKWIEGGYPGNANVSGDKHMLIVDRDNRLLFETWNTRCLPAGSASCTWRAGSGAVFGLDSNARRPEGWTSADAAGLAILPGLIRYDEAFGTEPIRHAFRVTVRATNGYVYPASHRAGSTTGALPMGARLRLKAGKDLSSYPEHVRRIFQAMKTYGLIVADNGSDLYIQGAYDTRWDNGVLNPAFSSLKATDFDVVELGWRGGTGPLAGPARFYTISPCRVLDTRDAPGPYGGPALPAGGARAITITGRCGIPATATAVSANLTIADATDAGTVTAYPGAGASPGTNTISFVPGKNRANNVTLGLLGGTLSVAHPGTVGFVNLILDVNGYYQ